MRAKLFSCSLASTRQSTDSFSQHTCILFTLNSGNELTLNAPNMSTGNKRTSMMYASPTMMTSEASNSEYCSSSCFSRMFEGAPDEGAPARLGPGASPPAPGFTGSSMFMIATGKDTCTGGVTCLNQVGYRWGLLV